MAKRVKYHTVDDGVLVSLRCPARESCPFVIPIDVSTPEGPEHELVVQARKRMSQHVHAGCLSPDSVRGVLFSPSFGILPAKMAPIKLSVI